MQKTLLEAIPESVVLPLPLEHTGITLGRMFLPDYLNVVVMRNPYEIFPSVYNLACHLSKDEVPSNVPPENIRVWKMIAKMNFVEYTNWALSISHCCCEGGFLTKFTDNNTVMLDFNSDFIETMSRIVKKPLKKIRVNEVPSQKIEWNTETINAIRDFCYEDFEKYNYRIEGSKYYER